MKKGGKGVGSVVLPPLDPAFFRVPTIWATVVSPQVCAVCCDHADDAHSTHRPKLHTILSSGELKS